MTIKQQGGVFGRNPTFNDVDVAGDLTVGGSITNTGTQNITGQLNVDNVRIDGNTVSTTDTNGNLLLTPNGTGSVLTAKTLTGINTRVTRKILNNWAGQGNGVGFENTARYEVGAGNDTVRAFLAAGYNTAGVYPNVGAVGTLSNHPLAVHINGSKVAEFTTAGNLAFNNGLGIDFSATSGTGTSELFDDYEEGTWTATVGCTGNATTTTTVTAYYTKIGRQVTVSLRDLVDINTTGLSGFLTVTLPFTCISASVGFIGALIWDSLTYPAGYDLVFPYVANGGSAMAFAIGGSGIADSLLDVSAVTSGTTDLKYATLTYFTA